MSKKIVRCSKARLNCVSDCPHKEPHVKTETCDHMQGMAEEIGCGKCIDIKKWYWTKGKNALRCAFMILLVIELIAILSGCSINNHRPEYGKCVTRALVLYEENQGGYFDIGYIVEQRNGKHVGHRHVIYSGDIYPDNFYFRNMIGSPEVLKRIANDRKALNKLYHIDDKLEGHGSDGSKAQQ